jgi:hypothetical protein
MVVVAPMFVVQLTDAALVVIPDVLMFEITGGADEAQVVPAVVIV